jgi:ATP-binding cassette, subfamily B, bacterial
MSTRAQVEEALLEDLIGKRPDRNHHALRRGWKLLPRVLPYLRPYRKFAVLSVLITILLAVVVLAEPWPLAFVIDSIIGEKPLPGWLPTPFGTGDGGLIALAIIATLLLTLLSGGLTVVNEYLSTTVDQRMVLDLRSDMFEHAQKLSLAFHDNERKGVLMYRINQQATAMGQIIVSLPLLAQAALTVIGMAIITAFIDPLLAAIALGTTPFIAYSTTFYADRIEPRIYRVRGLGGLNLAIVYEAMVMMRVVMAFGRERHEFTRFRRQGEEWADATVELTVRQTAFQLAVQFITSAGTAAVIGVGAYQAINGQISAGELLVILNYIAQVYTPLEQLTITLAAFQQWFINLEMAFDLMDKEPEVKEKKNARALGRSRGEIELEHVGFSYQARPGVLNDVSFAVPAGRSIAIVGPTGAGKSTLASLIPRFYDVAEGRVLIDGNDVRDLKLRSLRSQFSIVLQEPLLFSASIFENIRYGKPEASVEEVEEAAKAANAHEFIKALPDGYDTVIGEQGAKTSGGERQRIAVARAFLRDAPILILDEPTSSIDSRTESVILEALERLMKGRTTIVIAHRLSTIRSVEEILVMHEGRLVQRGPHEDLIAEPGLYRELWEAQTRVYRRRRPKAPASAAGELEVAVAAATDLQRHWAAEGDGASEAGRASPEVPQGNGSQARRGRRPIPQAAARLPRGHIDGASRPKVVLLGMLTKIPVGGVAWLVGQYAVGFERLGYDVYYVEAHARTPTMFTRHEGDNGTRRAVRYLRGVAERFGLENRWAFQALHEDGRCYGMSAEQLDRLYQDAALIINLHGGTLPLPAHVATDRLVFLGTDPVDLELQVHRGDRRATAFLDHHVAHFTWALNFGNPDCPLPWAHPYSFVPSPPPVVLDFWDNEGVPDGAPFTTIGTWRQPYRDVHHEGQVYRWSKHQQFMRFLDLPQRTQTPIELALSRYDDVDRLMLAEHGWRVRPGLELSRDLDGYRDYVVGSAGELSVAKEQNVHFRTGWFSERSATYLAAGRPVILQDTGFGAALPTGVGLFAFADEQEAGAALESVHADPGRHSRAAREIAREYLSHEVVLGDMLEHLGLRAQKRLRPPHGSPAPASFPAELPLAVSSTNPPDLPEETVEQVLRRPVPAVSSWTTPAVASVIVPVSDDLVRARLALESVLANTAELPYEVVVVDNGSADPTREYLDVLAARNPHVRVIRTQGSLGFADAYNLGVGASNGTFLVFLASDVIVTPGWLPALAERLDDPAVGIAGPATNGHGAAPEAEAEYRTYGELLRFARERAEANGGRPAIDVEAAEMSCAGVRRDVLEAIGELDGDGDGGASAGEAYVQRVRAAGYRVVRVEELFVHRHGKDSATKPDPLADPGTATMPNEAEAAVGGTVAANVDAPADAGFGDVGAA